MGHTYTNLLYHLVFSTKKRRDILSPIILSEMIRVVGGIVRNRDGALLAMNGTCNHVHLLSSLHPKHSLSEILRDIKAVSSEWVHEKFSEARAFAWQDGYSAFTVSESGRDRVATYIARQQDHHRQLTFEEEIIALLERHGIKYDKRFVLD